MTRWRRVPDGVVPATPASRLLAFVALQTGLVALLAAATGALTDTAPLLATGHPVSVPASGPAAVATVRTLQLLLLVAVVLAVLVPLAVGGYVVRRGERPLLAAAWAGAALVAPPVLLAALALAVSRSAPLAALAVLVVWGGFVVGVYRLSVRRGSADADGRSTVDARPPATAFLGTVVGVVLVAAVLAVPAAVPGQHDPLVVSEGFSAPAVEWEFDYRPTGDGRGVLTITHRGGDVVDADDLLVRGSGFADVPGANQTAPGPWQGSVLESGRGVVAAGDSVAIGVESDCHLRLVYDDLVAVGEYTCPDG